MTQKTIDQYAVIGNPIKQSLSPVIHAQFAEQTGEALVYDKFSANEDEFEQLLDSLKQKGLKGLNVTMPYKLDAFNACVELSDRAKNARAVNTLFLRDDNTVAGDNTDGVGIVRDLMQNLGTTIKNQNVLILGAGGAVRGVIAPILEQSPNVLMIANRTVSKAQDLADSFSELGNINACGYDDFNGQHFDIIINATSTGLSGGIPPISSAILAPNALCYDMVYNRTEDTAFVAWSKENGVTKAYDGLGMLVEQAAESFYLWRGVQPKTAAVIQYVRNLS